MGVVLAKRRERSQKASSLRGLCVRMNGGTMLPEQILDALYIAIIADDDLARVHALLSDTFDSHCGLVLARREDRLEAIGGHKMNPDSARNYNEHLNLRDPYYRAAGDAPYGSFITGTMFVPPHDLIKTAFYDGVFAPSDIWDLLGVRVGAPDGDDIYYCLYKPTGRVFQPEHKRKAAALVPHLQRAHLVRAALRGRKARSEASLQTYGLTPTEKRVLKEALTGATARDIARRLGVTENTLNWHLGNIYQKTDVKNRAALLLKFAGVAIE